MKSAKIILINIFSILALLLIIELMVRWIGGNRINYQGSSRGLFEDSVYFDSYGLKPGARGTVFGTNVFINGFGLRGSEKNVRDNRPKILLIGDSVLFGVGVQDSLTIRSHLQKNNLDSLSFINSAVIGYGLYDYHNVIRFWLSEISIQQVHIFYVLNDLYSASIDQISQRPGALEQILRILRTQSKTYLWIKNGLLNRGKTYYLYDYSLYEPTGTYFIRAQEIISHIVGLCNQYKVSLRVWLLPYRYQYFDDSDDPWRPQHLIRQIWEDNGVSPIDVKIAFPADRIDQYYLYGDPMHLSAHGHRQLAEFVMSQENQ